MTPFQYLLEQVYGRSVVMVWMRDRPKRDQRFHRTKDCRQLRKGPSRGEPCPLIQVDLEECDQRPCATCYPDLPRLRIRKDYCYRCGSRNACEHNGGVRVISRDGRRKWVWPDSPQMPYYRRTA